jgi:GntR family transcriptional regulator/MocR family aminotransferase
VTLHVSLVGRTNLSREIYRQIRDAVVNGVLRGGERLPPTRVLARTLSVSRMTVTVAYELLTSEGFVVSRVGAGTFVSEDASRSRAESRRHDAEGLLRPRPIWQSIPLPTALAGPATFEFRSGIPDGSLFPHQLWRGLLLKAARAEASARASYGDPAGHPALREAISRSIGVSRGVTASADDVTVTNGTQHALDILTRVLLEPGDRVAVEDPGYWPPGRIFEALGARTVAVPVDREGLIVSAIPRRVRVVYVTPSHQYPLGVSMTLARRRSLLAWAERNDAAIIEDDYDSEFRFGGRPLEPLRALDVAGRVIYVGSFSKTLLPSLRLAFVVTPRSIRSAVHRAKFLSDWHSPTLLQAALARFIDDGLFARHLRRVNAVYRERHELVTTTLARDFADHLELYPSTTGLHVAARARNASVATVAEVARRAVADGVAVQLLSSFFAGAERRQAGLVLGYGGIATSDIDEGLRRLLRSFDSCAAGNRKPALTSRKA